MVMGMQQRVKYGTIFLLCIALLTALAFCLRTESPDLILIGLGIGVCAVLPIILAGALGAASFKRMVIMGAITLVALALLFTAAVALFVDTGSAGWFYASFYVIVLPFWALFTLAVLWPYHKYLTKK